MLELWVSHTLGITQFVTCFPILLEIVEHGAMAAYEFLGRANGCIE
jgi:hypothetical protein